MHIYILYIYMRCYRISSCTYVYIWCVSWCVIIDIFMLYIRCYYAFDINLDVRTYSIVSERDALSRTHSIYHITHCIIIVSYRICALSLASLHSMKFCTPTPLRIVVLTAWVCAYTHIYTYILYMLLQHSDLYFLV